MIRWFPWRSVISPIRACQPRLIAVCEQEAGLYAILTSLSIGTPPQSSITIISLVRPELFVFSSHMNSAMDSNRSHYNSSLSSTFRPNGTDNRIDFPTSQGSGIFSKDDISVADVIVEGQTFTEVIHLQSHIQTEGTNYEGVLGLGRGDNLVTGMFDQGSIEQNVFSIVVPRDPHSLGELRIGSVETKNKIQWIEMTDKEAAIGGDRNLSQWGLDITSITFGPSELGISYGKEILLDTPAWIETDLMWIALPGDLVSRIHKYIGAKNVGWGFHALECEGREKFPDLSFRFGKGEVEVNVTASDYLWEMEDDGGGSVCLSLLADMEEYENEAFLGMAFFRAQEVSFDAQRKRIGCKSTLAREIAVLKITSVAKKSLMELHDLVVQQKRELKRDLSLSMPRDYTNLIQ